MNANELADELERPMLTRPDCLHFGRTKKFMEQVIAMLRQQADRIKLLEHEGKMLIHHIAEINESKNTLRNQKSYIVELEQTLESSINLNKAQTERNNRDD